MAFRHNKQRHFFHIVDRSPWPILVAFSLLSVAVNAARWFHYDSFGSGYFIVFSIVLTSLNLYAWWRDVVREGTFEGQHTLIVQRGLRLGFILFIVSEVMFFFSFFWAFFNSSLAPDIALGCVWPPALITPFDPLDVPLLNTEILLLSGAIITYAHYALLAGARKQCIVAFAATLFCGALFTGYQAIEYLEAPFSISDSAYGATFFLLTGFHGLHVFVGTCFIAVCFFRYIVGHFTRKHHLGFEFAAWYWHFVDVVWLFLYLLLYCWGGWSQY